MISSNDGVPRQLVKVGGREMSVAVAGHGPTVVLLHGNATYSYTWRNLIPYLAQRHRCIAPDLLGMGYSARLEPSGAGTYAFAEHVTQIELLLELLAPDEPLVLIGQETGGAMAAQYSRQSGRVVGLGLIEAVFRVTNDKLFDDDIQEFLAEVRGDNGEVVALRQNRMIDYWLPRLTMRRLSPAEQEAYRAPYARPGEARRALLSMIKQLPLRSFPGPLDQQAEDIRQFCAGSNIAKLVIGGDPGFIVPVSILGTTARWQETTVKVAPGMHFLTEDSPARLTATILDWLDSIDF